MLLTTREELQKYISTTAAMDVDVLKPYLQQAEQKYLLPILGKELYVDVQSCYYDKEKECENAIQKGLIEHCQNAEAHLAYYIGYPVLSVNIGNAGFHRVESDKQKTMFKYQELSLQDYFLQTGYDLLEQLIDYLEAHIDEEKLAKWKSSAAADYRKYFINSATLFTEFYSPLKCSRLIYQNLRSAMDATEQLDIRPILGAPLFDRFKLLITDRTITDTDNKPYADLLPYIQRPIAYLTIQRGYIQLGPSLTDRGFLFADRKSNAPRTDDEFRDFSEIEKAANVASSTGRAFLTILKQKLEELGDEIENNPYPNKSVFDANSFNNSGKKIIRV
jgi:hypothetical protein